MTFVFAILFEFFTPKKAARSRPFLVFRRDLIIVRLIQLFISKTYHKFSTLRFVWHKTTKIGKNGAPTKGNLYFYEREYTETFGQIEFYIPDTNEGESGNT